MQYFVKLDKSYELYFLILNICIIKIKNSLLVHSYNDMQVYTDMHSSHRSD